MKAFARFSEVNGDFSTKTFRPLSFETRLSIVLVSSKLPIALASREDPTKLKGGISNLSSDGGSAIVTI